LNVLIEKFMTFKLSILKIAKIWSPA